MKTPPHLTKERLDELFQLARDSQKFGPELYELMKNVAAERKVCNIVPRHRKEITAEDRQRFHEKMNTPYGL